MHIKQVGLFGPLRCRGDFLSFFFSNLVAMPVCRALLTLLQLHRETWLTPARNRPPCHVYWCPNVFTSGLLFFLFIFFLSLWRLFLILEEQEVFVFGSPTPSLLLPPPPIFKLRDAEPRRLPYWSQLR